MMYQVGDIVHIRNDLRVGSYYGLIPIKMTYDMLDAVNTVGEVTEISEEELAVKVNGWWWSEVMVNDISVAKPSPGRWISVDEALPRPDRSTRYLIVRQAENGYRSITLAWIDNEKEWHGTGTAARFTFDNVTHWMPLPPLPETTIFNFSTEVTQ